MLRCKNCYSPLPDNARFCGECGAPVVQNVSMMRQQPAKIGFFDAVKLFFTRYVDFNGRSRRSEYWYIVLFNMIMGFLIGAIIPDLAGLWTLATLLPGIALCIRRLHDVGKSGWWYLFIFLPLVGAIILLIQFCKDSEGPNQWGPSPKY